MNESMNEELSQLLRTIERWPVGVPVRAMERVLAMGAPVVPVLIANMPPEDDEERELLWYLALLAELRSPDAILALIDRLVAGNDILLRVVTAEALAKTGAAAIPALQRLLEEHGEDARLYAYGALGWIPDDAAYAALIRGLQTDAALADVIACALSDQGRREAIPALYDAYLICEPWQRLELRSAIQDLHGGVRAPSPVERDWRLRYYRQGVQLGVDLTWLGICAIVRKSGELSGRQSVRPVETLEEICAAAPEPHDSPEHCQECGTPFESPTGVPVFAEDAVDAIRTQLAMLQEEREAGRDDLFDVLDELDAELWHLVDRPEPRSRKARDERRDLLDHVAFLQNTCLWCIGEGMETIGPARARLLAEIGRLADRHGEIERHAPHSPVARAQPKVGRNDPCPCGSGKKYKHCCLG
jgi:hypothetical protein